MCKYNTTNTIQNPYMRMNHPFNFRAASKKKNATKPNGYLNESECRVKRRKGCMDNEMDYRNRLWQCSSKSGDSEKCFEFKLTRNVSCDPFNFIVCNTCGIVDIYAFYIYFCLKC